MRYRVDLADNARDEIQAAFDWIVGKASLEIADRWLDRLEQTLESLETMPQRCERAPESDHFQRDLRQLLFGRKHGTYRLIFGIEEVERRVTILHFRHAAMRWIGSEASESDNDE